MCTEVDTTLEERSPLLWEAEKPELFVGTAGRIRCRGRGRLFPPARAYYVGVIWVMEGELDIRLEQERLSVIRDQACFLDNGSEYRIESRSDAAEFIYISLDGKASEQVLRNHNLWEGVFRSGPPPVSQVETIMSRLSLVRDTEVRVTLVEGLDLVNEIRMTHGRTAADRTVFDAEALIRRCWDDPLFNINAVYEDLNANRSSLALKFKEQTGLAMLDYLHNLRLRATMCMLRETDMAVARIARDCGFSDPSYFARFFKKRTGMSPQVFREQPA